MSQSAHCLADIKLVTDKEEKKKPFSCAFKIKAFFSPTAPVSPQKWKRGWTSVDQKEDMLQAPDLQGP